GNVFSFYYPSRLDIGLTSGGRFDCEDMRPGCSGMVSQDGWPGDYSYIAIVTSPDRLGAAERRPASPWRTLGGCPSNRVGCCARTGGCERGFRSFLLRVAFARA